MVVVVMLLLAVPVAKVTTERLRELLAFFRAEMAVMAVVVAVGAV